MYTNTHPDYYRFLGVRGIIPDFQKSIAATYSGQGNFLELSHEVIPVFRAIDTTSTLFFKSFSYSSDLLSSEDKERVSFAFPEKL